MTRTLRRFASGPALVVLAALAGGGCAADADAPETDAPAAATTPAGGDEMFFKKKGDGLLAVGSPAPEFSVPDQDGKVRTLSEFKGRRLLIWFYPKADTPG